MSKRIYVHIGLHKCASTSIQCGLADNSKELAKQGILYPRSGTRAWGQHNVPWKIKNHHMYDSKKGDLYDLITEVNRSKHDVVVISSEVFSTFSVKEVESLGEALKGFTVTIIVYLRNQVDWLQSMWGEVAKGRVQVQSIPSLNEWVSDKVSEDRMDRFLPYGRNIGNYKALIDNWAAVFGSEAIRPIVFEDEIKGNVFRRFMELVGAPYPGRFREPERVNESFSIRKLDLIRRLRIALREYNVSESMIDRVKEKVIEFPLAEGGGKCVYITPELYDAVIKRFDQGNSQVAREYLGRESLFCFEKSKVEFDNIEGLSEDEVPELIAYLLLKVCPGAGSRGTPEWIRRVVGRGGTRV